jgi:hypothetical protein
VRRRDIKKAFNGRLLFTAIFLSGR